MVRKEDLTPHPVQVARPDIARWAHGNAGVPYVHVVDSGLPGPDALITALVHGNEYTGAIVLDELLAAGLRPRRGRLTLAFCNVDAFARFDPRDPDASRFVDEDFNRVWSADRLDGPGDSAELRRARALRPFVDRCTHLLDLHSMHEPCVPLLVTGVLPDDIAFARDLGCHGQIVIDEGHADGMRMRDYRVGARAGQRRSLLVEAGQHWDAAALAHARAITGRWLVASGAVLPGDVPAHWRGDEAPALSPVRVTHRVVARSADFAFVSGYTGGEVIARAGTPIAVDAGEPVRTPYDDCVLVMPSLRQLRPGVTTVRLGRLLAG
jgi:predicted deacylase